VIHLQIISRNSADVQAELREAIEEQRMTTFEIEGLRGGLRLRHKRFAGEVRFRRDGPTGPELVSVRSRQSNEEWQLLSAFIGRLTDRFRGQIAAINIQLEADEPAKPARKRRRRAKSKK
jgi:hypothetical protein